MKMVKGATTTVLLGCALFFFTQPLHAEAGFMPLPAQANELNIAPYCARAGCLYFALPSIIYKAVEIRILHILAIFLNTGLPVEFGLDTVTFGSINNIKQIEQSI